MADLILKARQDRRLKRGHLWVYSNEVDVKKTPLDAFEPGQEASLLTHAGEFLGRVTVNPNTLVCGRIFSRKPSALLDVDLFATGLRNALALRETAFSTPHYRLVHGEGDLLPGLVVDRYGDVIVAQVGSVGIERRRDDLLTAFDDVLTPTGVLWRNDSRARDLEGLDSYVTVGAGEVPEQVEVFEGGQTFAVDPFSGQKTGWFFDQRGNRQAFRQWVGGKRVLDVFSYIGAWSVAAAAGGASSVTAVDSSNAALAALSANALANGLDIQVIEQDALVALKQLREQNELFDVIVIDPPALIKRRKDHRAGIKHYHTLNQQAVRLLSPGGVLVSCSCSHHLAEDELTTVVEHAMHKRNFVAQLLARGDQGVDHPVHPAMPETRYLKSVTARALSR